MRATHRNAAVVGSPRPEPPDSSRPGHSAFALGMALLPHPEGLFQASAWYGGATSTATIKEI